MAYGFEMQGVIYGEGPLKRGMSSIFWCLLTIIKFCLVTGFASFVCSSVVSQLLSYPQVVDVCLPSHRSSQFLQ